jgi:alkaline phosphatase
LDEDGLTYTPLLYGNGPGFIKNRTYNLLTEHTINLDYKQESAVPLAYESHGGEDVTIYAAGPMSFLFDG